MRFLIVDDHEMLRRGLAALLADEFAGAVFGEAADAAGATRLLEAESWDLLLLDINLEGRSGLDVLEDVRRRWPKLPVLVVSAYREDEFAIRCLRLGAAGYVPKYGAADELVPATRKVLSGGRYVTPHVAELLAAGVESNARTPHDSLSTREIEVLILVATGLTQKEIAARLHLSEKTVATYRSRLSEKLNLSNRVELTRYAIMHKLL